MGKLILTIVMILLIVFAIPLFAFLAWNGFAAAFNLPFFSYWHWVAVVLAIKGISTASVRVSED